MWLQLAAGRLSGAERDEAVDAQGRVAAGMTPAMIGEAQRLARDWTPRTGDVGPKP